MSVQSIVLWKTFIFTGSKLAPRNECYYNKHWKVGNRLIKSASASMASASPTASVCDRSTYRSAAEASSSVSVSPSQSFHSCRRRLRRRRHPARRPCRSCPYTEHRDSEAPRRRRRWRPGAVSRASPAAGSGRGRRTASEGRPGQSSWYDESSAGDRYVRSATKNTR